MTKVVRVKVPVTPVMVTVKTPEGVFLLVITAMVDEFPVTELGLLKLALAPSGNPLALNVTASVKPGVRMIFTV